MFCNYKSTMVDKALIGIARHGMGMHFSDIYPGSLSDSEITAKANVLGYVNPEREIMSGRGFAIQDFPQKKYLFESS